MNPQPDTTPIAAQPAPSSEAEATENRLATPEPDTEFSKPSPISALQQLPGEPPPAFRLFMSYASVTPVPTIIDFAERNGLHRNTLFNWKKRYRWDERLSSYHLLCANVIAAPVLPEPPTAQHEPASEPKLDPMLLDLRANAMKLARAALESWEPEAHPTSLQGVVRALELACKLNPPPVSPDASKIAAAKRSHAEFLARLEKIYSPEKPKVGEGEAERGQTEADPKSAGRLLE